MITQWKLITESSWWRSKRLESRTFSPSREAQSHVLVLRVAPTSPAAAAPAARWARCTSLAVPSGIPQLTRDQPSCLESRPIRSSLSLSLSFSLYQTLAYAYRYWFILLDSSSRLSKGGKKIKKNKEMDCLILWMKAAGSGYKYGLWRRNSFGVNLLIFRHNRK